MTILQIELKVPDFDAWKKIFDSDPIERKEWGVKQSRVSRLSDDPDYVVVELSFENVNNAQLMLAALKNLRSKVFSALPVNPKARILEIVEAKSY